MSAPNNQQPDHSANGTESWYKDLVDNAWDLIQCVDKKGRFIYVNHAWLATLNYTAEEIDNISLWDVIHPDSMEHCKAVFKQALAGKTYSEVEIIFINKDGVPIVAEGSIDVKFDDKRRFVHTLGIFRDVTSQKQTEVRNCEKDAILKDILETTLAGFWDWNLIDNTEYLSPNFKRMFGYEDHEMENSPEAWQNIIYPEDLPGVLECFDRHVKSGGKEPFYNEVRYRHKDGSTVWVICTGRVTEWAKDGTEARMIGCHIDITERKRAENVNRLLFDISNAVVTVQSLEDLYRSIHVALGRVMDVTNFFIAIVDMQKRTLYFPYHVDTEDDDFIPIMDFDPAVSLTGLVVSERQPVLYKKEELEKRAQKGRIWGPVPLIWMGTPLVIEDEVIGVVAVQSYSDPDLYSEEDLKVLTAVSDQMASAIARKRAEEELLGLKKFNERIVQNINEGIIISDEDGLATFANEALLNMLGYKADEFIGTHWTFIVPADQHSIVADADKRRSNGLVDRYELALKHKNGSLIPVQVSGSPYYDHKTGLISGTLAVLSDVSELKKAQELIIVNEERLRLMTRNIQDVVLETDINGYYTYVSESSESVIGYNSKELLGQRAFDFLHPDDAERVAMTIISTFGNSKVVRMEYRYRHRAKGYIWVEGVGRAYQDSNNETMVLITIRDITERKQAEEALLEEQSEKALILNNLAEQVAFIDPEMRIIWANSKVIERHNLHNIDFRGQKCYELYHGLEQPCPDCTVIKALETGETASGIHKSPDNCYWQMSGIPINDQNGNLIGVMDTALEITDLVESKEALTKSEAKYRSLTEKMSDILWTIDLDLNTTYVSPSVEKVLGFTIDERMQQPIEEQITPETLKQALDRLVEELAVDHEKDPGRYVSLELDYYHKDGSIRCLETTLSALRDDSGIPVGVLGMSRDITDRKKYEAELKHLSYHDQLTGLYNRHFLEEEMKRLNTERQLPISIIMTDLNGLKLVNDTYGHQIGDEMLIRSAAVLKSVCREDDLLARFGGDEFLLFLPHTSVKEAEKICNRIEKACRKEQINDVPLSLATGVAVKLSAEQEIADLLREAENNMYRDKLTESRSGKSAIVNSLLQTLSAKSFETEVHTRNMQEAAKNTGEKLDLPDSEMRRLQLLITLHDIGKINIPEELLTKKGSLSDSEWEIMKKHSETGYRIAKATENFVHVAEDILAHHERWDGSGYPQGLKGEEIPLLARITAIVDAYEVMSNGRPYKKAMSRSNIVTEFKNCSGTQFDPDLVELFLQEIDK